MQKVDIAKFSDQNVGKMEMAFLNKDLEDRLTPETKTCLRLEPIE